LYEIDEQMNTLNLSLKRSDENSAELFVILKYEDFEGRGSCHIDIAALIVRAEKFALFPLPSDGSVCVEGGYFNDDMRGLKQTHLHLSAQPGDKLGNVTLCITLAKPVDEGVRNFEANLTCKVPATYEQLKNLSEAMVALAKNHADEYRIDLQSHSA
jgi:hypothetical protein